VSLEIPSIYLLIKKLMHVINHETCMMLELADYYFTCMHGRAKIFFILASGRAKI